MGTEYVLYTNESIEVCIDEMSNKLTLELWKGDDDFTSYVATEEMSPEDMLKMFLEGIKNVSYYMDKKEFNKIMSTMENYSV